jgi:hypothetical protein
MFDSVFSPNSSAIFRAKTPDYVKPKSIKINLNRLESGGVNTLTDAFSRVVSKALKDLEDLSNRLPLLGTLLKTKQDQELYSKNKRR